MIVPLFIALCLFGLASYILTALALVFWKGRWRVAAVVPVILMAGYCAKIGIDVNRDKTSHNLLPFEVTALYSPAGAYLIVLQNIQWAIRRKAATPGAPKG